MTTEAEFLGNAPAPAAGDTLGDLLSSLGVPLQRWQRQGLADVAAQQAAHALARAERATSLLLTAIHNGEAGLALQEADDISRALMEALGYHKLTQTLEGPKP